MTTDTAVIAQATLKDDGTLELDERLPLPPGRVQITVRTLSPPKEGESMMETLKRIWADQDARGYQPPCGEALDAYLKELRSEWDERDEFLERIRSGMPLEPREPGEPETAQ